MTLTQLVCNLGFVCLLVGCGGSSTGASKNNASSVLTSSVSLMSSVASSSGTTSSLTSTMSNSSAAHSKPVLLNYGTNRMQVGELRLPPTGNEATPLVIIIHGGCWVSSIATYHFMDTFAQAVTDLGYATWNIEYRALGTGGEWPVIFQDINKAVDYSRVLAQNYSININKVAVIGHSAGGHLALWAASRKNLKNDSVLYTENPLGISGVISLAGIANVTAYNTCGTLANDVIGFPITPVNSNLVARLSETSPLQMLPIKTKTILISGSDDSIVPSPMGSEYSNEAAKHGDASAHHILQGFDHFDLIDPYNSRWLLYQQSLQEIFKD